MENRIENRDIEYWINTEYQELIQVAEPRIPE